MRTGPTAGTNTGPRRRCRCIMRSSLFGTRFLRRMPLRFPVLAAAVAGVTASALWSSALPALRQPDPHPCVQRGDVARPVPPAPGQPAAIAVVTTATDAAAGRTRAWVGDTAQHRCIGFVETAADA